MILIAHRGNLTGPDKYKENHPDYILKALDSGYTVEIDVWYENGKFYLGHDGPWLTIDEKFLLTKGLWCHAKTPKTLDMLLVLGTTCFFHNTDACTLTSNKYIWTFPNKELTPNSIIVIQGYPKDININSYSCAGICSDYIKQFK